MPYNPEELGQEVPEGGLSEPFDFASLGASVFNRQPVTQRTPVSTRQPVQRTKPPSPLDEIEYRLGLARYYRALIEQPLFDEADQLSQVVQHEVSGFIMTRLGELLGTSQPKTPKSDTFSQEEVVALKSFAKRLLSPSAAPQVVAPQVASPPPEPEPVVPSEPKVRASRKPRSLDTATAKAQAPTNTAIRRNRRSEAADPPAAGSAEAPAGAVLPIPMPRGQAMTMATATQASQAMESTNADISRQLGLK
jgi:hypothetical protein